jgi:hypothetical protein
MEKRNSNFQVETNESNIPALPSSTPVLVFQAPEIIENKANKDDIVVYMFLTNSNQIKIGKIIEKREKEILIHPSSKKEKMKKGMKYLSYFFDKSVEQITVAPTAPILLVKLNSDGGLSKKSISELNLVLNGRILS